MMYRGICTLWFVVGLFACHTLPAMGIEFADDSQGRIARVYEWPADSRLRVHGP